MSFINNSLDSFANLNPRTLLLVGLSVIGVIVLLTVVKLMNPILFIAGIVASLAILYAVDRVYIPYFLPELSRLADRTKGSIMNNLEHRVDKYMVKGVLPLSTSEIYFNTNNPLSMNYVRMDKSVNAKGGSEQSYSFWLNKRASANYQDRVILLKGIKNQSAKAPLIKFGRNSNELVIEFNTIKKDDNRVVLDKDIFKVISGNDMWYLITVIFRDYFDPTDEGHPSGVQMLVYINDHLADSGHVFKDDALKLNNSPLYILPSVSEREYHNLNASIADVKYHNYALNQAQIMEMVRRGHNDEAYKTALQLNDSSFGDTKFYELGMRNNTEGVMSI